jgi:hypothetical protein
MNGQLELSAEQVISAIRQLDPAEKAKVRRYLPVLFNLPQYSETPDDNDKQPASPPKPQHQYAFAEVRRLLREVPGSMSDDIIAEREDRF